jgi:hypothetical protein
MVQIGTEAQEEEMKHLAIYWYDIVERQERVKIACPPTRMEQKCCYKMPSHPFLFSVHLHQVFQSIHASNTTVIHQI